MVYVVVAFLLARKAGWCIGFTILALVAGLVPLLIFWVERRVVQQAPGREPRPGTGGTRPERVTTAFVLGGGGVLGAVEVGMLRALFERDLRPDLVLGTSIGAFNGALVAQSARPRRRRAAHRAVAVGEPAPRGRVRRPAAAHRPPRGRLRHPPLVRRAAAAAARRRARRPHLRGAAGPLPGLRGQHRALRRALVHHRPGRGRGDGQRRRTRAAAAGRGRTTSTTSTAAS